MLVPWLLFLNRKLIVRNAMELFGSLQVLLVHKSSHVIMTGVHSMFTIVGENHVLMDHSLLVLSHPSANQ